MVSERGSSQCTMRCNLPSPHLIEGLSEWARKRTSKKGVHKKGYPSRDHTHSLRQNEDPYC